MGSERVAVFFYGLFMDASLLASKGVVPSSTAVGYVEGLGLRIGARATLVPDEGGKAHGVLMTLRAADVTALYREPGLADYVAQPVTVALPDGTARPAACYLLPADKLEGTNPGYAKALLALAQRLGLPADYLREIRRQIA